MALRYEIHKESHCLVRRFNKYWEGLIVYYDENNKHVGTHKPTFMSTVKPTDEQLEAEATKYLPKLEAQLVEQAAQALIDPDETKADQLSNELDQIAKQKPAKVGAAILKYFTKAEIVQVLGITAEDL